MSIKQQVEDAKFLADNGRHLGALTNLMLAVAASSRKTFPKGKTKSISDPNKEMLDSEAFRLFVGGRIRKILFGDFGGPDIGNSGISVNFKGNQYDVAYILYKFYRCELVHEGELPEDIEFVPPSGSSNISILNKGVNVSISCGNAMVLDYGWIDLLVEAVVHARCNGKLFGISHFDLIPIEGIDESVLIATIVEKYNITPGRFSILKEVIRQIKPDHIMNVDDNGLVDKFNDLVRSGVINGGAITGLCGRGLTDRQGRLLPRGIEILREISAAYNIVEV